MVKKKPILTETRENDEGDTDELAEDFLPPAIISKKTSRKGVAVAKSQTRYSSSALSSKVCYNSNCYVSEFWLRLDSPAIWNRADSGY